MQNAKCKMQNEVLGDRDQATGRERRCGQHVPFVIARPVRTLVVAIRSPLPCNIEIDPCNAETRDADCHVAYGSSQ